MKIFVVATFSGTKDKTPSVVGHSLPDTLISDTTGVIEAFLEGGMQCIHLVMMKEKPV